MVKRSAFAGVLRTAQREGPTHWFSCPSLAQRRCCYQLVSLDRPLKKRERGSAYSRSFVVKCGLPWWLIYNMKFSILIIFKCTAQWQEVYSCCHEGTTTIHFQNFFIIPNLIPFIAPSTLDHKPLEDANMTYSCLNLCGLSCSRYSVRLLSRGKQRRAAVTVPWK